MYVYLSCGFQYVSLSRHDRDFITSKIRFALRLVGGLFVSLVCIRHTDLKALIAYSSAAHISVVIGGIMTLSYWWYYDVELLRCF
jgi:NADH:ubiquinone oxidoreductase subunit 4 (subunit M)